jgi:hypothetical protein
MPLNINGSIINSSIASTLNFKNIVSRGLVMHLDASALDSYPQTGSTWYDLTGNSNHGTITGATYTGSYGGGSLNFAGTNSYYVQVPHSSSLNISGTLTASNWVYYRSGNGRIMQKDDTGSGSGYTRLWETGGYGGTYRMELWHSDGSATVQYGSALTTNGWMHLTMTFDGSSIRMYQNASLISTGAFAGDIRTAATPLWIGGGWSTGEWFDGYIANALVYSRALNAGEVSQNYNAQKSRFGL